MKKILAASLLSLLIPVMYPFPADAKPARWVKLGDTPELTGYIDAESIRKEENVRFYWAKSVFKKQTPISGKGTPLIYSSLAYNYLDCTDNVFGMLIFKVFGANNQMLGNVGAKDLDGVEKIEPDSYAEIEKDFVCSK